MQGSTLLLLVFVTISCSCLAFISVGMFVQSRIDYISFGRTSVVRRDKKVGRDLGSKPRILDVTITRSDAGQTSRWDDVLPLSARVERIHNSYSVKSDTRLQQAHHQHLRHVQKGNHYCDDDQLAITMIILMPTPRLPPIHTPPLLSPDIISDSHAHDLPNNSIQLSLGVRHVPWRHYL